MSRRAQRVVVRVCGGGGVPSCKGVGLLGGEVEEIKESGSANRVAEVLKGLAF